MLASSSSPCNRLVFLHYSAVFYFWIYSNQFSPHCLLYHCLNLLCEIQFVLFLHFCSIYFSFRHTFCLLGSLYIRCSILFVLGTPYISTRLSKAACKPQGTKIWAEVMNKQWSQIYAIMSFILVLLILFKHLIEIFDLSSLMSVLTFP